MKLLIDPPVGLGSPCITTLAMLKAPPDEGVATKRPLLGVETDAAKATSPESFRDVNGLNPPNAPTGLESPVATTFARVKPPGARSCVEDAMAHRPAKDVRDESHFAVVVD